MKKLFLFNWTVAGIGIIFAALSMPAFAETVYVKYRGQVDLAPFEFEWVSRSSVIKRLCYDSKEKYVVVNLTGTYYHYCEVPASVTADWRHAESMGRYYNAQVKGRFDCRTSRVRSYKK